MATPGRVIIELSPAEFHTSGLVINRTYASVVGCGQKSVDRKVLRSRQRGESFVSIDTKIPPQICNDENWKLLTLPSTPKGQVKVHPTQGIQIPGIRYWSNAFKDPEIHHTYAHTRYDPFDAGVAYAYVRGQWVKCISEYYFILKGRLEKEIWLATAELQKRQQNYQKQFLVKAKKLAEFLTSAEAEEVLLSQRLMDALHHGCTWRFGEKV